MGCPFENRQEAEVPATPEEVWAAIATGPGIDSWFMGRSDVQPGTGGADGADGTGGTVRTVFGEYAPELDVTAWDPARRFAYRSGEAPDGRFIAYEFLIEGRAGGSTVLRTVTSGFLPGDDWADEFEAMTLGGEMYFRTLVEYLTYFAGRFAAPVTAFGPSGTTWARDRTMLYQALGLPQNAGRGDRVSVARSPGLGSPGSPRARQSRARSRAQSVPGGPNAVTGTANRPAKWLWYSIRVRKYISPPRIIASNSSAQSSPGRNPLVTVRSTVLPPARPSIRNS